MTLQIEVRMKIVFKIHLNDETEREWVSVEYVIDDNNFQNSVSKRLQKFNFSKIESDSIRSGHHRHHRRRHRRRRYSKLFFNRFSLWMKVWGKETKSKQGFSPLAFARVHRIV